MKAVSGRLFAATAGLTVGVLMFTGPLAAQAPSWNDVWHRYLGAIAGALDENAAAKQRLQDWEQQLQDWERVELQSLVEAVGAALQGQRIPTEKPFELQTDFLKWTDGNTFVPFTVSIDPAKVGESRVALYVFVTAHQEPSSSTPTPDADSDRPPQFVYADFIDVSDLRVSDGAMHVSRGLILPGGDYDMYVAIRDSKKGAAEEEEQEAATVMMLREEVSVPNFSTTALQISSVIAVEAVESLARPLTLDELLNHPYTLGTTRIVPKHGRSFGKREELSLVLFVYNTALGTGQKPDVTIEYTFHQQTDSGEE